MCQKARHAAAAKYVQAQYKAMALYFGGGDAATLDAALSKCRVKYTDTWLKLHAKALGTGSTCDAERFVDNMDGTVTDNVTGLQWEQKVNGTGAHNVSTTTTWYGAVNILVSNFDSIGGPCFAFDCDWRLPTRAELQTILSEPFTCSTSPCIDAIFGPTTGDFYWTITADAVDPSLAWVVNFGSGLVGNASLTDHWSFRAVRGGL